MREYRPYRERLHPTLAMYYDQDESIIKKWCEENNFIFFDYIVYDSSYPFWHRIYKVYVGEKLPHEHLYIVVDGGTEDSIIISAYKQIYKATREKLPRRFVGKEIKQL